MNSDGRKANSVSASATKSSERAPGGRAARFGPQFLAWVVLVITLAASFGGWYISRLNTELTARRQFDDEASRILSSLRQRLMIYQDVLHGGVGLFAASYSVERNQWRAHLESGSVDKRFPGIDGVGYIANVPRTNLDEFLRRTREDKTPDFDVQESGTNDVLMVVKYVEPEEPHRGALGHDISGDPDRRAVAEKARDTGSAAMSGVLALKSAAKGTQQGFLMMLPVYRHGARTETVEERRANIEGWVYGRFVGEQLMRGILENKSSTVNIQVFDGPKPDPATRFFDELHELATENPGFQPHYSDEIVIGMAGRNWTVRFTSKPAFDASTPRYLSALVGVSGTLVSLLLFGIIWSQSSTRQRAIAIAWDMTSALRQTNEQLQKVMVERQRAEQGIKDSEALYHSLVESLP